MAVSHWGSIRNEILPRLAAQGLSGPSLVARVQAAAREGLVSDALLASPMGAGSRLRVRLWLWWFLRRVTFEVDLGRPMSPSPVALVREGRSKHYRLIVFPLVYWRDGVRDEDFLRVVVQRSLDAAMAGVLPLVLGVSPVPHNVEEAQEDDLRWWGSQLGWPVVYALFGLFSLALLLSGYWSRYQG